MRILSNGATYWDRWVEMLLLAARTGWKADIAEATQSVEVVLGK
jgi:hypothetical protein